MKNISLKQFYSCDKKIYHEKVNCKHWSVDVNSCTKNCSLKKINPNWGDCFNCSDIDYLINPNDLSKNQKVKTEIPTNIPQSILTKTNSYVSAEISQFTQGKVSEEIFNKRKNHCMSCERRKNPHPESESIGWCTTCGCGITPRAALSNKLYIPTISCPLNKFLPEKGEGFNAKDAIDSVKGIATSVKSLFEKDK